MKEKSEYSYKVGDILVLDFDNDLTLSKPTGQYFTGQYFIRIVIETDPNRILACRTFRTSGIKAGNSERPEEHTNKLIAEWDSYQRLIERGYKKL